MHGEIRTFLDTDTSGIAEIVFNYTAQQRGVERSSMPPACAICTRRRFRQTGLPLYAEHENSRRSYIEALYPTMSFVVCPAR